MMFNVNTDELWSLDTRHLAAILAIARTRSISKAAEELGYGQSAVSQQLAALERVLGARLVDRGVGPRPVTLTAAGQAFLPHAQRIVDRLAIARRDLLDLEAGHTGHIAIGSFQSAGARLLPGILAAYRAAWPDIGVTIRDEGFGTSLQTWVRDGTIDVTFLEASDDLDGLETMKLLEDRYVAVVPPNHRLASRKKISLTDLRGEAFVGGLTEHICTQRSEAALIEAGVELVTPYRTDDNNTRQRLVHAGLGCAVHPTLTIERDLQNGGVVIPLQENIFRTILLAWSAERSQSAAVQRFIECAKVAAT
jgi:DNA-binding transcriptional LysR family regulator